MSRVLLLRQPRSGLPGFKPDDRLLARVPVYGTQDARRGFWKKFRRTLIAGGVRENRVLSAVYRYDQKCYSQPKNNSELFAVIGTQHRRPVELFLRLQQQRFLFTEFFLNYSSSRVVHVCVILYKWRPAGRKTRMGTYKRHLCLRRDYRQFFGSWFSDVNGAQTEGSERPDVEAPKKCSCPAACARLWRQPSLFGDDTHAVVTRPKWA